MRKFLFTVIAFVIAVMFFYPTARAETQGEWEILNGPVSGQILSDVWGTAADNVFALGSSLILHFDGTTWSQMTVNPTSFGTPPLFNAIWGNSETDVFAVGSYDAWPNGYKGCVYHYDGVAWSEITIGLPELRSVWGTSSTDIYVGGYNGTLMHFDGSNWVAISGFTDDFFGIWGFSGNDVFACGYWGDVLHFDGAGWSEIAHLMPLYALWGASGSDLFGAGTDGTSSYGFIHHYDGNVWTRTNVTADNTQLRQLKDIWGVSSSDVYTVGYNGYIYHYDGSGWSKMISNTYEDLLGVWATQNGEVFAVGEHGIILRYCSKRISVVVPEGATETAGLLAGQGAISVSVAPENDLAVSLLSDDPSELTLPASVTIPGGQTSAVFDLNIVDDVLLDGSRAVTISAAADGYQSGADMIQVHDSESEVLMVTVPAAASEGDGVLAGQGTVSVGRAVDEDVIVTLISDVIDEVEVPPTVTVSAGQTGAAFDLTILNDGLIDGTRTVTITAFVNGWTPGNDTIGVADNESAQLTVTVPSTANEGDGILTGAGSIALPAPCPSDLTIYLSSSNTAKVTVPASVTLPAGQTTAPFDLTILDDTISAGSQTVTISASATGFSSQSDDILVAENDLHHFAISAIGNGQAGIPFTVTITAQDANGNTATGYTGAAALSANGDGGAVAIQPAVTDAFTNGQWTGNVTVLAIDTAIALIADDGQGHIATSNTFAVSVGPLDHFGLSAVPSPQTAGVPFSLTVTALDALGFTDEGFDGSVNLSATSGPGSEVIVGSGTSSWSFPMYTYYHDARTQVIYMAAELGGAAMIRAVALDVTIVPGQTMTNWTIRMKHTAQDYYSFSPAWESDWTVVYQNNETIAGTGWVVFTLQTPFDYNGTDNLMVDFSFNNSSWTSSGNCRYTSKSQIRSLYYNTDSGYGDPLTWTGTSYPAPRTSYLVPNLKILTDGDMAVLPAVSGSFINGVWSGDITIPQPTAGIQIRAEDDLGHAGLSNVLDVVILDTDADGLADVIENNQASCTDAANPDTDGDGLADGVEDANQNGVADAGETSPCLADTDGDGLEDGNEASHGADPLVSDTDNDGINDGDEVLLYGTRPDLADTDWDGSDDGAELTYWGAAWNQDIDGDGLINLLDADSDDDGAEDGDEISLGSDPADPGSLPNACANPSLPPVSVYPYTEGFESGWGDWVNVTGDAFNWTRLSGSTSSSLTGPSGAAEGQYYAYTESSSPNFPGKTAILAGPRFDLNGYMQGALTFSYHMYGAAMGTLSVQISTDGCNSWETVWSISGDQGNAWHTAIVDLDPYSGQTLSIRFHGLTGSSYTSDMGIDDLRVDAAPAIPCNDDVDCDDGLFCNGTETCLDQFCQPGIDPCPGQSCNEDLAICEEAQCLTDQECDDGNACTTDSCDGGVCLNEYANLVAVFPYNESFETGLGAWSNVSFDEFDWTRQSGSTSSYYTGPSGAFSGTYYLYTESSSPNYPAKTAIFEGPNFNLTSAAQAQMSFNYHMYGSAMGTLFVEVSTNCQDWATLWSLSGDQGDSWHQASIDLSAYAGQVIAVRFRGLTGSSYTSDMSIDNITVNAD